MSFILLKRGRKIKSKTKREKRKYEEKSYLDFVAFFFEGMSENVVEHSRFFRGTRFDRCPACDSFETGFVDGTVLSFLELREDLFEWDPQVVIHSMSFILLKRGWLDGWRSVSKANKLAVTEND